jgi:hypothetical protein
VNWLGRPSTFKPIDLSLEHLNCNCKIALRNFKNSTHNIELVFQRTALCSAWLRGLRDRLEDVYGEAMSAAHTSAAAIPDTFLLAWTLFNGGYAVARDNNTLAQLRMFDSCNVMQLGIDALEERVDTFNTQYVRHNGVQSSIPVYDEEDDTFVDIEAYADLVHGGLDAVNDAGVDFTRMETLDLT